MEYKVVSKDEGVIEIKGNELIVVTIKGRYGCIKWVGDNLTLVLEKNVALDYYATNSENWLVAKE